MLPGQINSHRRRAANCLRHLQRAASGHYVCSFRGTIGGGGGTALRNGKSDSLGINNKRVGTAVDTLQPTPSAVQRGQTGRHMDTKKINICGIISERLVELLPEFLPGIIVQTESRPQVESGEAQTLWSRVTIRKKIQIRIGPELPDSISVESRTVYPLVGCPRRWTRASSSSELRMEVPSGAERVVLTISKKHMGCAWQSAVGAASENFPAMSATRQQHM
jgi:hypothetical protein